MHICSQRSELSSFSVVNKFASGWGKAFYSIVSSRFPDTADTVYFHQRKVTDLAGYEYLELAKTFQMVHPPNDAWEVLAPQDGAVLYQSTWPTIRTLYHRRLLDPDSEFLGHLYKVTFHNTPTQPIEVKRIRVNSSIDLFSVSNASVGSANVSQFLQM